MQTKAPFLEKIKLEGHLQDEEKAKDTAELVFRTLRDLMTQDAIARVEDELHKTAMRGDETSVPCEDGDRAVDQEIADLWHDTDPIESALSQDRPPQKIDDEQFLFRIQQEANLPEGVPVETVIKAVFSATKEELSSERVQEISSFLPGEIQVIWESA